MSANSSRLVTRLKPLGPPLFGLAIVCGLFVAYGYPALHRRGQYGALEIINAFCSIIVLVGLLGFFAALGIGIWLLLASKQKEWPAKYYIPVVLLVAYFTIKYSTGMLQGFVLNVWMTTPFGLTYSEVVEQYDDQCTVNVQDDEQSGHIEDDWHAGEEVCGALSRRLHRLYPEPAWFFWRAPVLSQVRLRAFGPFPPFENGNIIH